MIQNGCLFLFRLFGIRVFLHWSWVLVGLFGLRDRTVAYSNSIWIALELGALLFLVLMHEFGHALACKSVGGEVNVLMLFPLGGASQAAPPRRAGAYLWTVSAGPLVNLILVPITVSIQIFLKNRIEAPSDLLQFSSFVSFFNIVLLVYSLLPVFPLDGGHILRGILWKFTGAGNSLMIAAWIGLVVSIAAIVGFALNEKILLVIVAGVALYQSIQGIKHSRMLRMVDSAPANSWFACPGCGKHPPIGAWWRCECGATYDPFMTQGICERCGKGAESIFCLHCQEFCGNVLVGAKDVNIWGGVGR